MPATGIDVCSSVPLYVEAFFGDQLLGCATAFLWLGFDTRLSLLTNWHVVSGRNHETGKVTHPQAGVPDHLRVHVPLNDLGAPSLIVRVPTVNADGNPLWVEHPKHGRAVDVAALDIDLPPPGQAAHMPMNAVRMVELKQRIGMPVFILGYPFGKLGIGFPIWKQATLASEPYLSPNIDHKYLIVDTASRPGMSGSPVIQRVHGLVELEDGTSGTMDGDGACNFIGIYSGRFHTNETSDAQLGRVWPAVLVREIVEAARLARASAEP